MEIKNLIFHIIEGTIYNPAVEPYIRAPNTFGKTVILNNVKSSTKFYSILKKKKKKQERILRTRYLKRLSAFLDFVELFKILKLGSQSLNSMATDKEKWPLN